MTLSTCQRHTAQATTVADSTLRLYRTALRGAREAKPEPLAHTECNELALIPRNNAPDITNLKYTLDHLVCHVGTSNKKLPYYLMGSLRCNGRHHRAARKYSEAISITVLATDMQEFKSQKSFFNSQKRMQRLIFGHRKNLQEAFDYQSCRYLVLIGQSKLLRTPA